MSGRRAVAGIGPYYNYFLDVSTDCRAVLSYGAGDNYAHIFGNGCRRIRAIAGPASPGATARRLLGSVFKTLECVRSGPAPLWVVLCPLVSQEIDSDPGRNIPKIPDNKLAML